VERHIASAIVREEGPIAFTHGSQIGMGVERRQSSSSSMCGVRVDFKG
jgi:hypothetical protein